MCYILWQNHSNLEPTYICITLKATRISYQLQQEYMFVNLITKYTEIIKNKTILFICTEPCQHIKQKNIQPIDNNHRTSSVRWQDKLYHHLQSDRGIKPYTRNHQSHREMTRSQGNKTGNRKSNINQINKEILPFHACDSFINDDEVSSNSHTYYMYHWHNPSKLSALRCCFQLSLQICNRLSEH